MSGVDSALRAALRDGRRVLWGGARPPLPGMTTAPALYDPDVDFRLSPEHHGAYDMVFLVDQDLGRVKQWPLILDEAVHALADRGRLVLRFTQGPFASVFDFMSTLHERCAGRVRPITSRNWKNQPDTFVLDVELERHQPRLGPRPSITFGVITDGRRPQMVRDFVTSVVSLEGLPTIDHEIVVCGPAGCAEPEWAGSSPLRVVEQPSEFAAQGWITRKKNLIVQEARGDVVVVAHDRYRLRADFLSELHAFGSDFTVVACRQETPEGLRFPDWVATGSTWSWSPVGMLTYGDYEPNQYLNGGIMLARRDVLLRHPWNELLFWNQAEDVELSRRMRSGGIIPRLARNVVAITELSRPDQMSAFELIPADEHRYLAPGRSAPHYAVGTRVEFTADFAQRAPVDAGLVLWPGWETADDGSVEWSGDGDPELSLFPRYDVCGVEDLIVRAELASARQRDVCSAFVVNGQRLETLNLPADGDTWLSASWPAGLVPERHSARIQIEAVLGHALALRSFEIEAPGSSRLPMGGELSLRKGPSGALLYRDNWGAPEEWGSWSLGRHSRLRFPISGLEDADEIRLHVEAMALVRTGGRPQHALVTVGGTDVGELVLRESSTLGTYELRVPAALADRGWLDVEFHVQRPVCPAEEGINPGDRRELGIGVAGIRINGRRGR